MEFSILHISDLHRDSENPTGNEALRIVGFVGAGRAITELNRRVTESSASDITSGIRQIRIS